jgi:MoaA/NifB/PqqE/SkfB family radical SAM enzyme
MSCNSNGFCVLPWLHMSLNPDGNVTLCCQSHHPLYDSQGERLNAQTHSLEEIWNSAGMADIRRRMAEGEELPHCARCRLEEKYGRVSYRIHSNKQWLDHHPQGSAIRAEIEASTSGAIANRPKYLNLRLGNLCNLACTICKPLYSSQIERDPVHSKWITDAPYIRLAGRFDGTGDWSQSEELLGEIIAIADQVEVVHLAGGEPTVNETHIAFLRSLCTAGRAASIDITMSSNLTNVRPEVFSLLARFRSLVVTVSIDGVGSTYEYVRYPSKWSALVRNVARLREACPRARLQINATLQALNLHNLADLFEWADQQRIPITLSMGRGLDRYNDARIPPLEIRDQARRAINAYLDVKGSDEIRNNVGSVFTELYETDFTNELRRERAANLFQFIRDMDRSRELSFAVVAPTTYAAIRKLCEIDPATAGPSRIESGFPRWDEGASLTH